MSTRVAPPPKSNEMKEWLNQFLRTDEDKRLKRLTHTWLVQGKKDNKGTVTYNVPEDRFSELYDLLHKVAFLDNKPVHLVERFQDPSTLKIDFDFTFENDTATRQYTEQHLKDITKLYHKTIQRYLNVPNEKLKAYVFERVRGYHDGGKFKDGFHMVYPEIVLDIAHQKLIRQKVLDSCHGILDRLPLKNASYDEVIDESIIDRNGWMMYGSTKTGRKPYLLTHIYDLHLEDHFNFNNPPDNRELIEYLSLFNLKDKVVFEIKPELKQLLDTPQIPPSQPTTGVNRMRRLKNGKIRIQARKKGRSSNADDVEMAKKLVSILDDYRADDYQKWIQVGLCLHNIDDDLLETWIEFSQRSPKYQPGECEEHWQTFKEGTNDPLGMGSLHHWARLDDPLGYETVKRGSLGRLIEASMNASTTAVARVVHEMYKYQYVCTSLKYNTWYEFRNHRWHEIDKGVYLQQKLSNEVLNEYLALNHIYLDSSIRIDDEGKEPYIQKAKKLLDVTLKLQDIRFKEQIMKECAYMFYSAEFHAKLDNKGHLLGFDNGVYNLLTEEFRDGRPEDYISLTTGIDYCEYGDDDPIVEQVHDFMAKVFPVERVRDYVWTLLASFLEGKNKDEKFHIWNGSGSNGKSKTLELLCMALGDYTASLPISLLTQKRAASNAASPELARCRGARFVYMQEPDRGQRMNIGYMKELTGGDKLLVRPLYKEPFEFKPMFKMILCCNDLPRVPPDDEGTWRRIRVIEFISKFTRNPKDEYEFPIDLNLSEKFHEWKEAFMYLLTKKFQIYLKQGGLNEEACPEVTEATREYQKQADVYAEFLDECVVKDAEGHVSLNEFYQKFREWWLHSCSGRCPDRNLIKRNIDRKLKSMRVKINGRNGYRGVRILSILERNASDDEGTYEEEDYEVKDDPSMLASLSEGQVLKEGKKITLPKKRRSDSEKTGTMSADPSELPEDEFEESEYDPEHDQDLSPTESEQLTKPNKPSPKFSIKKKPIKSTLPKCQQSPDVPVALVTFDQGNEMTITNLAKSEPKFDGPKPALRLGLPRGKGKTITLKTNKSTDLT